MKKNAIGGTRIRKIRIKPNCDLIFDNKVREQCRSCKRYGQKATCPPYTESVSYYEKLLKSYKHGAIYYGKFEVNDKENWEFEGSKSTEKIWKRLIKEKNNLISGGHSFVVAFGAGSCKLCASCSMPCKQPNNSLIPLEGTGVNVKEVMNKFGIQIVFPINSHYYRVGVVLWD